MAISRRPTANEIVDDNFNASQYSFTQLDDMINTFMIAYVGHGKTITNVPRHEVAFWMQRCVQEFNYDMFPSRKNIELEMGPTRTVQMPVDMVKINKITWIDALGYERVCYEDRLGSTSQSVAQDHDYETIIDQDGEYVFTEPSRSQSNFQNPSVRNELLQIAQNYYYNYITDYNYSYYNESYYGRQWGADPAEVNVNGTYRLDYDKGLIVFDYLFREGQTVTIRYISDGLTANGDLTQVFVPKLAEDAVYSYVLYNLSKLRPQAAGAAPLYKKEAKAKMNTAKIRLMNLNREEMTQIFRGKSKWIKH